MILDRSYPSDYQACFKDLRGVRSGSVNVLGVAMRVMSGVTELIALRKFIKTNPNNTFIKSLTYLGSAQEGEEAVKDSSFPNGWHGINSTAIPPIVDSKIKINYDALIVDGEVISDVIDLGSGDLAGVSWLSSEPTGSALGVAFRFANTAGDLPQSTWEQEVVRGAGANQRHIKQVTASGRHAQYKLYRLQSGLPTVWSVTLHIGIPRPKIRLINLTHDDGRQKYKYKKGTRVNIGVDIYNIGGVPIRSAAATITKPSGEQLLVPLTAQDANTFAGSILLDEAAELGAWSVSTTVIDGVGLKAVGEAFFLVVDGAYSPPQSLTLGAMVGNFGFTSYSGAGLNNLISAYQAATGIEVWKVALRWSLLEPSPENYNDEMLSGLIAFMDAALVSGKKVQVGIQQFSLPQWINDGNGDYWGLQFEHNARRLANLWKVAINRIGGHPALHSVLVVNEQNDAWGGDVYLRFLSVICNAIRSVNKAITIGARPNIRDSLLRTRYAQDGPHDIDYGTSAYPTFASTAYDFYGNPNDVSSYARLSTSRLAARATGVRGGMGEIGWRRGVEDTFTDADLTVALKRAMTVAYDLGYEEFMLWGLSFGYKDWSKSADLVAHRNALISRPRAALDFKVVIDVGDTQGQRLLNEGAVPNPVLIMADQPYAYTYQRLDELGLNWYYTTVTADAVQVNKATAQIALSELSGLNRDQQRALVDSRAAGIIPGGVPVTWPNGWN